MRNRDRDRNKKKANKRKVTKKLSRSNRENIAQGARQNKTRRNVTSSDDIQATKGMLDHLEQKLTHQITSCRLETKALEAKMEGRFDKIESRFNQMESRFSDIDSRFNDIYSRFHEVDRRFNQMDAKIEMVLSAVHKVALLVEEQNARNKFVLDGYKSLNDRLEKLERKSEEKDM